MKRRIALGLVLSLALSAAAQADTAKFLSSVASKTSGALAVLKYTVKMETGDKAVLGQAICIGEKGGIGLFMTTALNPRMDVGNLTDFELTTPGVNGKTVKAKLQGIDPWTGLGFVQTTEKHNWQVVQFSTTSGVSLGQEVASIGLIMGDPSHPVYLGVAYVSSKLRVPGELIYVTGGWLTSTCSPVFAADGRAIGIVGRQLFQGFQTPTKQGTAPIQLRSQQETAFFTPVEEFIHVAGNPPSDGGITRLPWMGINKFEAVGKELADILKLTKPAVKIDEVIPNQPAAKAGLGNNDIIIEVNGKPLEELATPEMSVRNFVRELMRMKAGEKLALKVMSGSKTRDVSITLGEMPTRPNEAPRDFVRALGLLVREKVMLDQFLDKSESAKVPGLLVLGLVRDSAAVSAGLKPGDVITNVNQQPVKTVQVFREIINRSLTVSRSAPINFLVRRGEQAQLITVKPAG
jgi:serine protease Do